MKRGVAPHKLWGVKRPKAKDDLNVSRWKVIINKEIIKRIFHHRNTKGNKPGDENQFFLFDDQDQPALLKEHHV